MGSGDITSLIPGAGNDRPGEELVKAKEFDLTQVAKQLAVALPIVMGGILGALELLGVKDTFETPAYVVAALGVSAAGVLGLAIVSAADIVGRAYAQAHVGTQPDAKTTVSDGGSVRAEEDKQRLERQDRLDKERLEREDRLDKERLERQDELEKARLELQYKWEKDRLDWLIQLKNK
jgi:hypothetical protein